MTADRRQWPRPVPRVGDVTSAAERASSPSGWALGAPIREALYDVIDARRDVRRYRPDVVPDDVLQRVLTAAHHGPSVGHSQPWRFVLVTDPATRDRAALLADRERLRQASLLEPEAARRLLDLQLEGIREAPLGVVVCCDRRVPAAGVLGRATFPDTDLWSCACAIQNMWLAARAEGLGMGWVTLFRPEDLAELLHLPDGVETLGWLCLGWPDERPPEPGLVRAGWSRRLALDEVVLHERWPDSTPPPVSHLRAPEPSSVVAARDAADRLLTSPGSLGLLDKVADRVVALGHPRPESGVLLLVGADHPVAALGVSAYDSAVTRDVLRAALGGEALGVRLAAAHDLDVVVVDAGVDGEAVDGAIPARAISPRGDLVDTPAMSREDATRLLAAGRVLGGHAARSHGLVALGEVGIGNTTVAAALGCGLLSLAPYDAVGLGASADSGIVVRKREVVAAALARVAVTGIADDPLAAVAELGGPEFAVLAGAVLGAAENGAAVVLDGLAVSVAALVAVRLEPSAQAYLVAGQRSRERLHATVLEHLGCEPLLDLRIRAGEGAGAVLAAGLVRATLAARRTTAVVDR